MRSAPRSENSHRNREAAIFSKGGCSSGTVMMETAVQSDAVAWLWSEHVHVMYSCAASCGG
eukprot:2184272-Alexandrium_andersonii.AAC.1